MKLWIGRPSGHSVYYTLIGTFSDQAEAEEAYKKCVRRYGKNNVHFRKDRTEIQVLPADEVWGEDELSSDIHRLENYGAEVEALENFWDFEIAFTFETPSASKEDIELLMLLKYPDLGKYLEYLDTWVEQTQAGKTRYHLGFNGTATDIPVDLSELFYHSSGGQSHEFFGKKIGTAEIPECELITCC